MKPRTCIHCGQPDGAGPRELRPYGPNGSDVCAECVFGGHEAQRERIAEAERQFAKRLATPGPHVLDTRERVGPRRIKRGKT